MLNNRKKKGYLKVMNSCVVVGKILKPVGWKEGVYEILLECNRPYLMEDGNFNTDVFSIYVWKGLAEQCEEVCKAGDLLAIRGRMEGKCKMEGKEEEYLSRIIAEKITFLTIKGKENGFVY